MRIPRLALSAVVALCASLSVRTHAQSTGGVPALRADLDAETRRATEEETSLRTAITNTQTSVTNTDGKVASEKARAQGAEAALQTNMNTEAAARVQADETLGLGIAGEAAARAAGHTALQANVAAEASARQAAVADLQAGVSAELSRAQSAETALTSALAKEASLRRAASRTSSVSVQTQIDALALALARTTSELAEVKAMLGQVDAVALKSPQNLAAACGSEALATRATAVDAILRPTLTPQVRAWTIGEVKTFAKTPATAQGSLDLVQRFTTAFPTGDVMGSLFYVLKESIEQVNSDKLYMLNRLAQMNAIADAIADTLQQYAGETANLQEAIGGETGSGDTDPPCEGDDSTPLSPAARSTVEAQLATLKVQLAAQCCGPGQDATLCSFIMDPLSCPVSAGDPPDVDIGVTPPTTVGGLRAVIAYGQAKLVAARSSAQTTSRIIQKANTRTSDLCQRLSGLVDQVP